MTNRYTFLNRKSLKPAKIGSAATRDDARFLKNFANSVTGRNVVIFDRVKGEVIR